MITTTRSIDEMMQITQQCLGSVSEQMLEWDWSVLDESCDAFVAKNGIYVVIPVESDLFSLELAINFSREDAEKLTRKMLLCEDDEELTEDDVPDTIGEVANVTAGEVKKLLHCESEKVVIGIPMTVNGTIHWYKNGHQQRLASEVNLGPVVAKLILVYKQKKKPRVERPGDCNGSN